MIIILLLGVCYAMAIVGFTPRMPESKPVELINVWDEWC